MTKYAAVKAPRILREFESLTGSYHQVFPIVDYEYEPSQDFLVPVEGIVGRSYGFDPLGTSEPLVDFGEERVRFSIIAKCSPADLDTEIETMSRYLRKAGRGWGRTIDSLGVKYKAHMRCLGVPSYTIQNLDIPSGAMIVSCTAVFRRYTPWFKNTDLTSTTTVTASAQTWVVNNTGNDPLERMIIRFRANTSASFSAWELENQTNGKKFTCTYVMDNANKEIKLDTKAPSVKLSTDDGGVYSDAWAYYTIPAATQRILSFSLDPGNNTLKFTGTGTIRVNVEISAAEIPV